MHSRFGQAFHRAFLEPGSPGRVWRWGLLVAAVAALLWSVFRADALMERWVKRSGSPAVDPWAQALSDSAKGHWVLGAGVLGFAVARWFRRRDWQRLGVIAILSTALGGGSATVVRGLTGRTRPSNPVEQGWFGPYHNGQWLVGRHAYNAFPSGHAGTAAAFAFALVLARRRLGWIALAWMAGVCWSRMYLSAHRFSDVFVGSLFGLISAWWVHEWVARRWPPASPDSAPDAGLGSRPGPDAPEVRSP
jgi:undecaprenyl-diphosphatase